MVILDAKKSLDLSRFFARLDGCFERNDLRGARDCLAEWEANAREIGDDRALLSVLNEAVGFWRRQQKRSRALAATEECLALTKKLGLEDALSGATIYINAATTSAFFGDPDGGLALYDRAAACYEKAGAEKTFEYASLLNNRAGTLYGVKRFDEAETCWRKAIAILQEIGGHAGEIAISLVMLAHLAFDRDDDRETTERLLDEAWEYLNSEDQVRDGNYAYVLRKCAPSFDYFGRPMEAAALKEVAKEIYERGRRE